MNKPTELIICGVKYKITYDPKQSGGITAMRAKKITIGTETKEEAANIVWHEALEAMLNERGLRYTRYEEGNDGIRFVLSHHEFENMVADIMVIAEQLKGLRF